MAAGPKLNLLTRIQPGGHPHGTEGSHINDFKAGRVGELPQPDFRDGVRKVRLVQDRHAFAQVADDDPGGVFGGGFAASGPGGIAPLAPLNHRLHAGIPPG